MKAIKVGHYRASESELTKIQELMYELRVEEIMTRPVFTIRPDVSMRQAKEVMRFRRISGLPVVEGSAMVGIVSVEDVIRWLEHGARDAAVRDWMTTRVYTVRSHEPAVQAINRFSSYKVGRLPVLDRQGELVGIVTPGDVINQVLRILDTLYREQESHRPRVGCTLRDLVSDTTTVTLRFEVPAGDFQRAGAAATRVKRILDGLGVDPAIVRRAGIAAYEAEMNLVMHTSHGGRLVVEIDPQRLLVQAQDDGPGIESVEQALTPGFSTAPDWIRELGFGAGMGLDNIRRCADHFSIESEVGRGTTVRATIAVDTPKDAATGGGHRPDWSPQQSGVGIEVGSQLAGGSQAGEVAASYWRSLQGSACLGQA
ncbi:MAG: CBS domain-containing protein [Sphingomonadaceae bacterium]